ncbi:hypothetical protein HYU19_02390 [Candidatus Woesearchaeota archaeon]|nr:hypothetical protein [Candidatus Woesearchaeota archaeon]
MASSSIKVLIRQPSRSSFFLVVLLLFLLFMATACQGGSLRKTGKDTRSFDYHTGSQGMVMKFLPGNPPKRLYEGDALHLTMEYSNQGATPVTGGLFYVSGYDQQYIHLTPAGEAGTVFNADGKSVFNPQGEMSYVLDFYDPSIQMPPNTDVFRQIFKLSACYAYRTEASAQVCIDPDPRGLEVEDKVCVTRDQSLSPQGGPVAVTSIQQEATQDQIQFKIAIKNVGRGTVLAPGGDLTTYPGLPTSSVAVPIANCHRDLTREQIDKVIISAEISGQPLECFPQPVRLTNGAGFSFCRLDLSTMSTRVTDAYLTNMNINLHYGYRDTVAVPVEIIKLPGRLVPYGYR